MKDMDIFGEVDFTSGFGIEKIDDNSARLIFKDRGLTDSLIVKGYKSKIVLESEDKDMSHYDVLQSGRYKELEKNCGPLAGYRFTCNDTGIIFKFDFECEFPRMSCCEKVSPSDYIITFDSARIRVSCNMVKGNIEGFTIKEI